MKKITLLLLALLSLPIFSFSGGIVHNTNQSAAWVRYFARDASLDIDAVFYNPAGLTKLGDGFFISLNNQTLFQNRLITSDYQYLNNAPVDYEGSVTVPILPSIYAAYNTGKFSFSFGMNVIGGGGTAEFNEGLPMFEMSIADLYPAFMNQGVTDYSLNAHLEGNSIFWGYQLGVSYAVNDMFSVYLGGRYVTAKNTYNGYLIDITVDHETYGTIPASDFLSGISNDLENTSTDINDAIDGGLLTADGEFSDPEGIAALTNLGLYQDGMTNEQAAQAFGTAAIGMDQKATILEDQTADVEQKGSGITPIIGLNINKEKFNIGLKYEFKTKLELENSVPEGKGFLIGYDGLDPVYKFPDKQKNRKDMPALLTLGMDYKVTEKFKASLGMHYYFDKAADYGFKDALGNKIDNSDVFEKNYWELAVGLEYNINEKLLISGGYLRAQSGMKEDYQTDLDYKISSNSFGIGGAYSISSMIDINIATAYTIYVEDDKTFDHNIAGNTSNTETVTETYNRDNLFFAIGLDIKFGK